MRLNFLVGGLFGLLFWSCEKQYSVNILKKEITEVLSGTQGFFALAFKDLRDTGQMILIHEKETFHAASTMKIPVMIEVFKQVEQGNLTLQDSLMVKNEFKSIVDSSLFSLDIGDDSQERWYKKLGQKGSVYDLMYDMIIFSSNLATNLIMEKVGAANAQHTMREMGAKDIQVLRGVEDTKAYEQGLNNTTTAYDLMIILEKIARGEAVNEVSSEAMINILLDQQFNEIIPAKLPKEVKVAHKTGWITKVSHDAAIVMLPDGRRYVLVLLSKDWESNNAATETMAEVSRLVYEFMVK